jgi:hypothetical protein
MVSAFGTLYRNCTSAVHHALLWGRTPICTSCHYSMFLPLTHPTYACVCHPPSPACPPPSEAIMLVETHPDSEQPWAVLFANEAWEQAVGVTRPRDGARTPFWDVFQVGWEVGVTGRTSHMCLWAGIQGQGLKIGLHDCDWRTLRSHVLLLLAATQPSRGAMILYRDEEAMH